MTKLQYYNYRVCYAICENNVPAGLVYALDQYGQHLLAVSKKTRVLTGTKSVPVAGTGDKRQITAVPVVTLAGDFVGLQAIWQGTTSRCLPKKVDKHSALHHTCSQTHWSTLPTMKELVDIIMIPDMNAKISAMGLNAIQASKQKAILLLDVWKVHLTHEYKEFLAAKNIIPIYLDPGMTSKEQSTPLPSCVSVSVTDMRSL